MTFRFFSRTCALWLIIAVVARAATYPDPTQRVLTHREQNELITPWIKSRFDKVLPALMAREGIDMWIIPTREYNEDPRLPLDGTDQLFLVTPPDHPRVF